ncbi:MAG TPA: zinc ribbon domain-containing protein [Solirubrobacteraceae bacterium]
MPASPAGEGEAATVVEQQPADARPKFRERTRMRRRMRELRRLREISFRDLGGLTFDLRRFGRERPDLVAEKLEALQRIDAELRSIETALDARRPLTELREPGIAACPRCGTLHGTDANFCPGCGTPLRGSVVHEAGPLRVTPVGAEGSPPAGASPLGQPPVGRARAGEPPTEQQQQPASPPPPS